MAKAKSQQTEVHEYQAEMQRLLDILVHSLYTDRDIFLRELVSNASDALSKVQLMTLTEEVLDQDAPLEINLSINDKENSIILEDSGCGMTHDELKVNLGTIAKSGTLQFLQDMQKENKSAENLIGQFGVGFYSVFMVARRVELETRSWHPDGEAWNWSSEGGGNYEIQPSKKKERGTKIKIFLKEDAKEFCGEFRLENIIKRYSNYLPFEVKIKDKVLNQVKALWTQSKNDLSDDDYKSFYKQFCHDHEDPQHHLHFSIDAPIQYHALIYFPKTINNEVLYARESHGVALYAQKVLIQQDNENLLPPYLRFVKGLIDSEDLPLNVSRENVQKNVLIERIKKSLTSRILKELETLGESQTELYNTLWGTMGVLLKEGVSSDFSNREKLLKLLRFNSSLSEDEKGLTSLPEYVGRMREEQKEIYYVTGGSRQAVMLHPNLEYFRGQGLEVLFLFDQIDDYMMAEVREFDGKSLKNISDSEIEGMADQSSESKLSEEEKNDLLTFFKTQLGERVEDVRESKRLVDSPCSLTNPKDGMSVQMEKMMKMMNQDFPISKRQLEINLSHPINRNLSELLQKNKSNPFLKDAVEQLFKNALLIEGLLENPVEILPQINQFMEDAAAFQIQKLEG